VDVFTIVIGQAGEPGPPQDGAPDGLETDSELPDPELPDPEFPDPELPGADDADAVGFPETGQIVVYKGIVTVVTEPIGQFVTVAGHFVTVPTDVVQTVEVVIGPELPPVSVGLEVGVGFSDTGQTVVYSGMTTVVSEPSGQLVTVAGHFVMVPVEVV
jgi:hypothetical protein